jgi:hypothetical protein
VSKLAGPVTIHMAAADFGRPAAVYMFGAHSVGCWDGPMAPIAATSSDANSPALQHISSVSSDITGLDRGPIAPQPNTGIIRQVRYHAGPSPTFATTNYARDQIDKPTGHTKPGPHRTRDAAPAGEEKC